MAVYLGTGYIYGQTCIVTTSGGNIYIFVADTGLANLNIYKSTDGGTSFSSLTAVSNTTIFGGAYSIYGIGAAIDGSGYIHVVLESGQTAATRDVSYAKLDTSSDSWSAWEQAASLAADQTTGGSCSIAIDSNSKPHVVYVQRTANMGTTYSRIYYTNKVGASWLTPEAVSTGATTDYTYPSIILKASNDIEITYRSGPGTIYYRVRTSGSWGTETSYTGYYSYRSTTTSGSASYRYGEDSSSYVWENSVQIGTIRVGEPTWSMYNNRRYMIYTDYTNAYLRWICHDGSNWINDTLIDGSTTFNSVTCEWAYNFEYQSGKINILYYKATGNLLYYTSINPALPSSTSKHAYTNGLGKTSSVKHAYIAGGGAPTSSKHAYMSGLGNADPEITRAVLLVGAITGGAEVKTSKHAYIYGKAETTKHAYISGVLGASASVKHAYTRGGIRAYKHAYTRGGVTERGSKHAYLWAAGERLVPDNDVTAGSWKRETGTSGSLFVSVRDSSDDTYVWYDNAVADAYFEVTLSNLVYETIYPTGSHYVHWRAKLLNGSGCIVKCELRQGSTVIHTEQKALSSTIQDFHTNLTSTEVALITNYNDLRMRITIVGVI